MRITKADILRWAAEGISEGADRMIVASDDFSEEYFPVFASDENFEAKLGEVRSGEMQRAIEVYDLHGDLGEQVNLPNVWRTPKTRA
jgi:hypothetical protein